MICDQPLLSVLPVVHEVKAVGLGKSSPPRLHYGGANSAQAGEWLRCICDTPDEAVRHTDCKHPQWPTQPELRKRATASPRAVFVVAQTCCANSTSVSSRIPTSFQSSWRGVIHQALHSCEYHAILHRDAELGRVHFNLRRSPDYSAFTSFALSKIRQNQG